MDQAVQGVDNVFLFIIGFSVFMLVGITVTMIVFLVKYRESRHPVASDIRGNWKAELIWTVLPTLIALSMFYYGWISYLGLREVPEDALEIKVIGVQYAWIFEYPNGKETDGILVVPQNQAVKLNITSEDVNHSLFIPAFRIKMDAVNGLETYTWFYADKPGIYDILCAEYCGVAHADMTATLRIVPRPEYEAWLAK